MTFALGSDDTRNVIESSSASSFFSPPAGASVEGETSVIVSQLLLETDCRLPHLGRSRGRIIKRLSVLLAVLKNLLTCYSVG